MDEEDFKKLASNSRDWLIYQLLSEKSKESVLADLVGEKTVVSEGGVSNPVKIASLNKSLNNRLPADSKPAEPKGETTVQETIQGIVRIVTDKAVQIVIGIRSAWIPKSAIKNLKDIVLGQGKPVSIDLHSWFAPKVEWKVI